MLDVAPWSAALRRLAASRSSTRFAVGLDNLSHVTLADDLAGLDNVFFFADVHLYTANRWTSAFLADRVPRLLFAYRWIEERPVEGDSWLASSAVPLLTVAPGFRAPLFASRGCFAKHVLHGGACPPDCPRRFRVALRQADRAYEAIVDGCVTYLFAAPPAQSSSDASW